MEIKQLHINAKGTLPKYNTIQNGICAQKMCKAVSEISVNKRTDRQKKQLNIYRYMIKTLGAT